MSFAELDTDKIGTHDFTYLVDHMIKWLEGHLALSNHRIGNKYASNKKHHQDLIDTIENLKAYRKVLDATTMNEELVADAKVKEAFEWLGNNIFKCWC